MNRKCQLKHNACQLIQFVLHSGDAMFMQTFVVGGLRVHELPKHMTSKELWVEVRGRLLQWCATLEIGLYCIYVCVCVYIHTHTHTHTHVCVCVYMYI